MTANDSSLLERVRRAVAPRFQVDREVARGGMGVVFEARDTALTRRVAIKLLTPEKASAAAALRFVREARSQAQLRHPNIVTVHDTLEADGLSFIIMEFVAGPTLQQVLKEKGALPLKSVFRVGVQVASALEAAHAHGIVHRDIKPSNIFLEDDRSMLADFGIAFSQNLGDSTITQDGAVVGTPIYMAPEQFGNELVDARADVYSLGLVLRELATAQSPLDLLHSGKPVAVPRELDAVVQQMVPRLREKRLASAAAVRAALERAERRARIQKFLRIAAGPAVLLGIAFVMWITDCLGYCPPSAPPPPPVDLLIGVLESSDTAAGRRLAGTLERKLDWFPLLSFRRGAAGAPDPSQAAKHRLGGELTVAGGLVAADLTVHEANGRVYQRIRAQGDTADMQLFACVIADSIIAKVYPQYHAEYSAFGCRRDPDIQAVKAYFRGAESFRRGRWAEAEEAFQDALQRDPGMMQAAWELMVARRFQRKDFDADLRWLEQRKDSLPSFYRALVEAQLTPELHERFRRYEKVVRESHQASKALLLYTNEYYHRGPMIGRGIEAVVDTMALLAERQRDMQHTSTYDISIWGNIRLGREDSARADLARRKRLIERGSPDRYGKFEWFAVESRFRPWLARVARPIMFFRPDGEMLGRLTELSRLGTMFDIPETQVYLGGVLAAHGTTATHAAVGQLAKALGQIMLGQTDSGLGWLDSAAALMMTPEMDLQRSEWPVMLAALGIPVSHGLLDDARLRLRAEEGQGSWRAARANWALGMDAVVRGDSGEAARRLVYLRGASARDSVAARLAPLLAAWMLGAAGQFRAAIDSTRPIFMADSVAAKLSPFARAAIYLGRGRWQRALGAPDAADYEWLWYENSDYRGWPDAEPQQGEVDAVLGVYGRLLRGELAAGRRSAPEACRHLTRVQALWRDADERMAPLRDRAESAAARAHCP